MSSDGRRVLVIPGFNEEALLPETLDRVEAAGLGLEVAVVDDGSRDRTAEVARRAGVRLLRHPVNLGYGAALQTGYKYALRRGAEMVAQLDADGQHDPRQIPSLFEPLEQDRADLVIGSRFIAAGTPCVTGIGKRLGVALLRAVGRGFGLEVTDPTSGFQALGRSALQIFTQDWFPADYPDLDALLQAHRSGLRIEGRRRSCGSPS